MKSESFELRVHCWKQKLRIINHNDILLMAMRISKNELIPFKIAVNEAAEMYGLTPSAQPFMLSML
ncbi:MAG: hypothetical protein ACJ71I_08650 [Nitrososphaeraceae archaeon]